MARSGRRVDRGIDLLDLTHERDVFAEIVRFIPLQANQAGFPERRGTDHAEFDPTTPDDRLTIESSQSPDFSWM